MKNLTLPQAIVVLGSLAALIAAPLVLKDNPAAQATISAASGILLMFTRSVLDPKPEDK